jgi:plasmid stabilization system protein ParE
VNVRVAFTARAQERLAEIEERFAERDPDHARKIVDKLISRAESLSLFPRRGRKVPEIDDDLFRELIEGVYRIVYRIRSEALLEIITVFDARRSSFPFGDVVDD